MTVHHNPTVRVSRTPRAKSSKDKSLSFKQWFKKNYPKLSLNKLNSIQLKNFQKIYDVKKKQREYQREYRQRPDVKKKRREYYQRPDVKARIIAKQFPKPRKIDYITTDGINYIDSVVRFNKRINLGRIILYDSRNNSDSKLQLIHLRKKKELWFLINSDDVEKINLDFIKNNFSKIFKNTSILTKNYPLKNLINDGCQEHPTYSFMFINRSKSSMTDFTSNTRLYRKERFGHNNIRLKVILKMQEVLQCTQ